MWIESSAPSNIALIKYMGKVDSQSNVATNASLSFTLEKLRTFVRVRNSESATDSWSSYKRSDLRPIELSENGKKKFLKHLLFLKEVFSIETTLEVESANNFPSDCGLASSASSFAALTLATYKWATQNKVLPENKFTSEELATFSRKGSGSSCRSLFAPWAIWNKDGARGVDLPVQHLKHQVLLCDETIKNVSSSEAHKRVLSSDMFVGRIERAEQRLEIILKALSEENWKLVYEICWNELWDMHTLFHTSNPPFFYMNETSLKSLKIINEYWQIHNDGPVVTMDAGSNIHLLFRVDQKAAYFEMIHKFRDHMAIWTDEGYLARI